MATRIPARPAAAVPARPAAAVPARPAATVPQQGKANPAIAAAAPVAAAPAAAPAAPVVENTEAPSVETAAAPAAPVVENTEAPSVETAAAPQPKKRGRKPGSGAGAKKKTDYPGLFVFDEAGAPVMVDDGSGNMIAQRQKLTTPPADFNAAVHNKLRENDFTDEAVFCDFNAARLLAMSQSWERKAKKIRALGSATDRKQALKFLKMREQLAKLHEQLAAQGMTEEMLAGDDDPATE